MTASTQAEHPAIARAIDARVQNELGERWVHVTFRNGHGFNVPILRLIADGAFADASGHAHWGNTDFDEAYERHLRRRWVDDDGLCAQVKALSYDGFLRVGGFERLRDDDDAACWARGAVDCGVWGRDR